MNFAEYFEDSRSLSVSSHLVLLLASPDGAEGLSNHLVTILENFLREKKKKKFKTREKNSSAPLCCVSLLILVMMISGEVYDVLFP